MIFWMLWTVFDGSDMIVVDCEARTSPPVIRANAEMLRILVFAIGMMISGKDKIHSQV